MKIRAVLLAAALVLSACSTAQPDDLGSPVPVPGAPTTSAASSTILSATYDGDYSCDVFSSTQPNELPALVLPCMDGSGDVDMNLISGPTVLTIWASWCIPCKKELPAFTAVNDLLKKQNYPVHILGLNWIDDPQSAVMAAREWGLNFPSVHDGDALMRAPLGINAQPATLFIDESGRVVHVERAPIDAAADLVDKIQQHLGVEVSS